MSDDRVIAYLRVRGQAQPPADLVPRVMAAVDSAPAARSFFATFLPAAAVAGAITIAAIVAMLIGQGIEVGPDPSESAEPTRSEATVEELRAALDAAVGALRETPGVEGTATSSVLDELSGATWFTWRPNGDQVVIQRTDVDVAQTGWWLNPGSEPPARGRNVSTSIHVFIANDAFVTDADAWVSQDRVDAPPAVTLATALLDGEMEVSQMLLGDADGEVAVTRTADGAETWSLTAPYRDGTATAEWQVAPDGTLRAWSHELIGVTPSVEDTQFITSQHTEFTPLADPGPIEPPDTDSRPDAASLGLPADFPLGADASGDADDVAHVGVGLVAMEPLRLEHGRHHLTRPA